MKPLNKAQRVSLVCAMGCFRGTSTAALECIGGLLPIHLCIQMIALNTQKRLTLSGGWLQWREIGALNTPTHRKLLDLWSREIGIFNFPCDPEVEKLNVLKSFETVVKSKREWDEKGMPVANPNELFCFTDGSGIDGTHGTAFHVPQISLDEIIPLGSYALVPQAETVALLRAADRLMGQSVKNQAIHFYVDCFGLIH